MDNRQHLISMAHGSQSKAVIIPSALVSIVMPYEVAEAYGADLQHSIVMPCVQGAVYAIIEGAQQHEREADAQLTAKAPEAHTEQKNGITWEAFATHDVITEGTEEELQEIIASCPCLVNYGGTLQAVGAGRQGSAVVILKDMQGVGLK